MVLIGNPEWWDDINTWAVLWCSHDIRGDLRATLRLVHLSGRTDEPTGRLAAPPTAVITGVRVKEKRAHLQRRKKKRRERGTVRQMPLDGLEYHDESPEALTDLQVPVGITMVSRFLCFACLSAACLHQVLDRCSRKFAVGSAGGLCFPGWSVGC